MNRSFSPNPHTPRCLCLDFGANPWRFDLFVELTGEKSSIESIGMRPVLVASLASAKTLKTRTQITSGTTSLAAAVAAESIRLRRRVPEHLLLINRRMILVCQRRTGETSGVSSLGERWEEGRTQRTPTNVFERAPSVDDADNAIFDP